MEDYGLGGLEDKGYVRAQIDAGQGAFDAGAYSFFGDMAPLDEGLGGALEDGLMAPPEEVPAEEGALDEEDDLPIEDLLDTDDDEDLSLAALLRKRMQQEAEATNGLSAAEQQQQQQQHQQPLLPPMPPKPHMLSTLGHQQQQQQLPEPQQQRDFSAAASAAAPAAAPPLQLPDAVALDAIVSPPGSRPVQAQPKPAAQQPPAKFMTAEELEARMLQSAAAAAAAAAPAPESRGTQLLSMLKGPAGAAAPPAAAAATQEQQRHVSTMHAHGAALMAAAQQQLQQLSMGATSAPLLPPHPAAAGMMPGPAGPGMGPGGFPPQGPPHMQPPQQQGPGGVMLPPPHPGTGMPPPPEVLAQLQQQQQQRPPLLPGQQLPAPQQQQQLMGPPPAHFPGMGPPAMGPPHMGPGGPPMGPPGAGPAPGPGPMPLLGPQAPPHSMPLPLAPQQQQQHMAMQMQMHMAGQPGGPPPMGPPQMGAPPMGPGGMMMPPRPAGAPMPGMPGMPGVTGPHMPGMMGPGGVMQPQLPGGMLPPHMRPGQELLQGPGQPPHPGAHQPFPGGAPMPGQLQPQQQPQQQMGPGFKQAGPPPGFQGPPAALQQQQQRQPSPGAMHGGPAPAHLQQQQQVQGQPPGGRQQPPWAGPGPAAAGGLGGPAGPPSGGIGLLPPPRPQQPQQQGSAAAAAAAGSDAAVFGSEYLPTATTASAEAMRVVSPAALVHRLRTNGSSWMGADDINHILRIQFMATHSGVPYMEDFYFQAFCNKYFGGRNAVIFAPQQLREFGADLHDLDLEPRFADLAGLGRVVLSNIRTPKMLMDVGSGSSSSSKDDRAAASSDQQEPGGASDASKARPLEQEPMLAARIMVEDCMLLLCDVEDIDRMLAAAAAAAAAHAAGINPGPHAPGPVSPALAQGLLQRRSAMLGGIAASFRLPDTPTLQAATAGAEAAAAAAKTGDRVFVRILALPKGRSLVTKTLKLMFSPPPAAAAGAKAAINGSSNATGLDLIWALLRNAQLAFGPALVGSVGEAERRLTDATIALSAITSEMVKRLQKPEEAVACLAAAVEGLSVGPAAAAAGGGQDPFTATNGSSGGGASSACQLLPLYPAGRAQASASPEWLGQILASLLLRASELGLGSFAAAAAALPARGLGDGGPDEAEQLQQLTDAGAVPAAVAAEWSRLLNELVRLVELHLYQLVLAVRGSAAEVAAAAGAGPGSAEILLASVPKMACVPLMRVLMAHCSEEQQEQLKGYLAEVGR